MPRRRIAIDVMKEVPRIRYECGRSYREIASARRAMLVSEPVLGPHTSPCPARLLGRVGHWRSAQRDNGEDGSIRFALVDVTRRIAPGHRGQD